LSCVGGSSPLGIVKWLLSRAIPFWKRLPRRPVGGEVADDIRVQFLD